MQMNFANPKRSRLVIVSVKEFEAGKEIIRKINEGNFITV
jgi:hypothetical protein